MGNFFGNIKQRIIDKKKRKVERKFKLEISGWIDGVLTKKEHFFDSYEDAVRFTEDKEGHCKVYDDRDQLIHSEHRIREKRDHHGHHGHHHGHHHDDDDDMYA